jgi:hypothetical protein
LIASQGRLFSHIGDACCYCSSLSSTSDTTCSLSSEGHSRSDNNTHSPSSEGHSLDLSAQMSPPACPFATASCTRSKSRAFSPQKASVVAGRLASCVMANGASGRLPRRHPKQTPLCPPGARHRPPCCFCGRDAASDPPSRRRLPRRKSSSRWKLIAPFY